MCKRKGWACKDGGSGGHYQSRPFSSIGPIPRPVQLPIMKNVTASTPHDPSGCQAEEKFPKAQHTIPEIANTVRASWSKAPNLQCKK